MQNADTCCCVLCSGTFTDACPNSVFDLLHSIDDD